MTFSLGQSLFDLPENGGHRAAFPFEKAQAVPKADDLSLGSGVHDVHSRRRPNLNEKRTDGKPLELAAAVDRGH
jgi:hypothetical protein